MNRTIVAACLAIGVSAACAASAEQYVDYTPVKGAWEVTTIRVDPNHIDDYLTGLKKGWIPVAETLKKNGVIDQYLILQKLNSGAGDNIQLIQHFPSLALMDPDKARDQSIEKQIDAVMSKSDSAKMTGSFDKYRTFVSDEIWTEVQYAK
jgi:hypothetical protein